MSTLFIVARPSVRACVRVCVCVCVCVCALCLCLCMRAYVRACVRVHVRHNIADLETLVPKRFCREFLEGSDMFVVVIVIIASLQCKLIKNNGIK